MTTAGEALVDQGVVVGGEAVVGGIGADTGVVVVPGAPSGVTRQEFTDLVSFVSTVAGNCAGALTGLSALANRPRDFQHIQTQPSPRWQVPHHLGFCPTFTAYDTNGDPIAHGGITHPVPGQISEVVFGAPVAGGGVAS